MCLLAALLNSFDSLIVSFPSTITLIRCRPAGVAFQETFTVSIPPAEIKGMRVGAAIRLPLSKNSTVTLCAAVSPMLRIVA